MSALTERQLQILDFLRERVRVDGYPPSQRDIAAHFGFSQNAARDHLKALERKGEISIDSGDARAIRLRTAGPDPSSRGLPVLGHIAAGAPLTALADSLEAAEDWISLDAALFHPPADFLHRVAGDSMIGAGILDGDLVGIHAQPHARNGQIVAACLYDPVTGYEQITLKRYAREGGLVRLHAENPRYAPIEVDLTRADQDQELPSLRLAGVMCGLLRVGPGR